MTIIHSFISRSRGNNSNGSPFNLLKQGQQELCIDSGWIEVLLIEYRHNLSVNRKLHNAIMVQQSAVIRPFIESFRREEYRLLFGSFLETSAYVPGSQISEVGDNRISHLTATGNPFETALTSWFILRLYLF